MTSLLCSRPDLSRQLRHGLLAAILLLLAGGLQAVPLVPGPAAHSYPAGLSMDVLEDETSSLDIAGVSSPLYADRFRPVGAKIANYGFRRSALWFRLQIDFREVADSNWHLVETHPILDHLQFFLPDGQGGWESTEMGDTLPFSQRIYLVREFVLPLPRSLVEAPQPVTLYMRVSGQGALNVDFRLLDGRALAERINTLQWGYGLFFGALAVMFLYNVALFLVTRERSQFHYIVWLGGFALIFIAITGYGLELLWPDFPVINGWFPVFVCIALWGGMQFTRSFLDLQRDNQRADRAFHWTINIVLVVFLLAMLLPRHWIYILGTVLPVLFAFVMMGAGIVRWRQGYQPARLFVYGWIVLLAGCVLLPLANFGVLPMNTVTAYGPQFGAVLQSVLLSLALGDKVKLLKSEKEQIERESHEKLEQMFGQLRALDADKLRFLHYLSHELNTPLNWMAATRTVESGEMSSELKSMVEAVESGQQRMMDLVSVVLGYFDMADEKPGSYPVVPVAPMWLVDDLLRARAAAIAAKKLQVHNKVPADLVVLANEQRLRRVLGYLVDNALNFSEPGQEITLGGGSETYGTRGVVSVRDQGRGIDPENLPRLFEPFFMVGSHHRDGGFGLSLATARLMTVHMGGEIRAHSEGRSRGAEFQVVLPMATSAAAARDDGDPLQSPAA